MAKRARGASLSTLLAMVMLSGNDLFFRLLQSSDVLSDEVVKKQPALLFTNMKICREFWAQLEEDIFRK